MVHYLYKITNTINGKYYLGMHSCNSEENKDEYMGSGKALKRAFKKYNKDSFTKEILAYFNTREELCKAEALLITKDVVNDKNSYNMKTGGEGGTDYLSKESKAKISKANKGRLIGSKNPMWGKSHTIEDINKMKSNHSLYGKPSPQGWRITIDGIDYESLWQAAEKLDITAGGIRRRILSKNYLNYRFTDESKNTHKAQKCIKIHNTYYKSLREAERLTLEPRKQIADKIKCNIEGYCYETITNICGHRRYNHLLE